MNTKRNITIILLIAVVVAGALVAYKRARALLPFGGMITFVKVCECPVPGLLVTVSPPVGGVFLYTPTTVVYPNWNIGTPGAWVLGLHTGTPVGCGNFEKGFCAAQVPAQGIMTMVGTS